MKLKTTKEPQWWKDLAPHVKQEVLDAVNRATLRRAGTLPPIETEEKRDEKDKQQVRIRVPLEKSPSTKAEWWAQLRENCPRPLRMKVKVQ